MNRIANNLCCLCLLAVASVGTAYAELADRDKPMHLEANRVVVDDAKQHSIFEGQVQLTQGTLLIQADKVEVSEDAHGFQHLTASGSPAKFWQRFEGSNEYAEGYGNRIEYDTRTETVDFFGQARVKRGQDEVSGAHITYSTKTEVFEVHGDPAANSKNSSSNSRVHAVIQPKSGMPTDKKPSKQDTLVIQPSSTLSPSETVPSQHE